MVEAGGLGVNIIREWISKITESNEKKFRFRQILQQRILYC